MTTSVSHTRTASVPLAASAQINPERQQRMWSMTPDEREAAARRGEFSLGELCQWASRAPREIEIVDGEFWFITARMADYDKD